MEGWRMFRRSIHIRRNGYPRYEGNAEEICEKIVKACWNGNYFQTSTGHFSGFYMRDFGISAEALMSMGHEKEVYKTIQYCLNRYSSEGKLTTTITPGGKPVDIFHYAPDTLAFLLRTLRVSGAEDLVKTYQPFIIGQVEAYARDVLDSNSGLVNLKRYSGMRDHAARKSSCYDNCMTAMISSELGRLSIDNPLKGRDFQSLIKNNFWNGSHFTDELDSEKLTGDANVFPFWCGVFDDAAMFARCRSAISRAGLDKPFPLRYEAGALQARSSIFTWLAPGYEGDTVWAHLGLCYLDALARYDSKAMKQHLDEYSKVIEGFGNLIEVLRPDGRPYGTLLYAADDSLIWAAKYLHLRKYL
jgi:hypothetical protein